MGPWIAGSGGEQARGRGDSVSEGCETPAKEGPGGFGTRLPRVGRRGTGSAVTSGTVFCGISFFFNLKKKEREKKIRHSCCLPDFSPIKYLAHICPCRPPFLYHRHHDDLQGVYFSSAFMSSPPSCRGGVSADRGHCTLQSQHARASKKKKEENELDCSGNRKHHPEKTHPPIHMYLTNHDPFVPPPH